MALPCLSILLASVGLQAPATVQYRGGNFIIRENGQVYTLPAQNSKPKSAVKVLYRKDENYVVWDSRGLTIRKGDQVRTSRLPDISLTPKLFSKDQILETKDLMASGQRSKAADALSGSKRIGDDVYLLPRWDSKDGKPWLEALIVVNLKNTELQAKLLGSFKGLTPAGQKVDDLLYADSEYLYAISAMPDKSWGVGTFDLKDQKFSFEPMGRNLVIAWRIAPKQLLAEERTAYGSTTLDRVDVDNHARRVIEEFRGTATLLSTESPVVVRITGTGGDTLLNLETGAALRLSKNDAVAANGDNVVRWPQGKPGEAELYSPERWDALTAAPPKEDGSGESQTGPTSRSRNRRGKRAGPANDHHPS